MTFKEDLYNAIHIVRRPFHQVDAMKEIEGVVDLNAREKIKDDLAGALAYLCEAYEALTGHQGLRP